MAQTSYAVLTVTGRQKEAAALGGGDQVVITHIAIGDGATVPSGGETELYNETARKTISGQGVVAGAENVAYADIFLEAAEGPYTIREAGMIDSDGDLIAIAHFDPPINKPVPASGQTVEGTIRMEVAFSDLSVVVISVDPSMTVALQRLSTLPWIPVKSLTTTAPPVSPAIGDTYVIPAGATGTWSGHAQKVAEYTAAGWAIITPRDGHGVGLPDGRMYVRKVGTYVRTLPMQLIQNAASAAGLTLDDTDLTQLSRSILRLTDTPILGWQSAPPGAPAAGDSYVVQGTGTGAWAGHDEEIALYYGGSWVFIAPKIGHQANFVGDGFYKIIYFDGTVWAEYGRKTLTADLLIYVATDGDDDNDGLAAETPFLTLQKAVQLARSIDTAGFSIKVDVAAGSYSGAGAILDAPLIGGGSLIFEGDPDTPGNVTVSNTQSEGNTSAFVATGGGQIVVDGFTMSSVNGDCLFAQGAGSVVNYKNVVFANATNGAHVRALAGQCIIGDGVYAITGNAQFHFATSQSGSIYNNAGAQTISTGGTLTFSQAFASAGLTSSMALQNLTFSISGSVSGTRYAAASTSTIFTAGGGPNYFPGSVAGTTGGNGYYG